MLVFEILLVLFLLGLIIAYFRIKFLNLLEENEKLNETIKKKNTLIKIYESRTSVEDNNKIIDIYRIKTEPNEWIYCYPSYIRLILEESIQVDPSFYPTIKRYIKENPDTLNLPGTKIYINK